MTHLLEFMELCPNVVLNRKHSELQIFSKYFDSVDQNTVKGLLSLSPEIRKDVNQSNEFRKAGNLHYIRKNYAGAVTVYTSSIAHAPRDSVEYGLSIANRSAALFELGRYKECLVDIERVCKCEYPKNILYKTFIRQAKCYLELKESGKALEAIRKAKSTFEIAKVNLDKTDIDNIVKKINDTEKAAERSANVCQQTVEDEEPSRLPELTKGENPQFAYASNTVCMKKNNQRGRHVVACADIKKGDVLFVEEPYSIGQVKITSEFLLYCSQCCTNSITCIPCNSCTTEFFCSDLCQEQYWNSRHRWECAGIRRDAISTYGSLALGILFRASHTGFSTAIADARVWGDKLDNYPYVNELMSDKNKIPREMYISYIEMSVFLVIYLIHFTDYFDWLYVQENRPSGSRDQLHRIIGGLLLKYFCQIGLNQEAVRNVCVVVINKHQIGLNRMWITDALYVSSSLMNHSCMPNAMKSFRGSTKVVRALTDIKKGTEITVSYLKDYTIDDCNSRQQKLLNSFFFKCTCHICTNNSSIYPWLCVRCEGRALATTDNRTAKCMDCQHEFKLDTYKKLEEIVKNNHAMCMLTKNINILNATVDIIQGIYHKTNWNIRMTYTLFVYYYDSRGDFKNCFKYVELLMDLFKAVHQDTAGNIDMLLKYLLTLVNYCLELQNSKPQLYKKILKQTKEVLNNSMDFVKYYTSEEQAEYYQQGILRILEAGDPNFSGIILHNNILAHTI